MLLDAKTLHYKCLEGPEWHLRSYMVGTMCLHFESKLLMEFSALRPTPHEFTAVNSWVRVLWC